MCDSCDENISVYGIYGVESYEMDGLKSINFEQILGTTVGYVATSAVDTKVKAFATGKTNYMKHLQNTYVRSGAYVGAGFVANAFVKVPFVKDMGKGAIVYGVKEAIAKMMPTLGIGNPNSTVTIGNPNTTIKIENTKNVRDRSLQTMMNKEKSIVGDARLTGIVINDAMPNNEDERTVIINY